MRAAPAPREPTPAVAAQARPWRHLGAALGLALGTAAALALAATAALLLWASREGSVAQLLAWTARMLPAGMQLQWRQAEGALLRGGRIAWLQWQQDRLTVTVEGLRWHWADDHWARLGRERRLALAELAAQRVRVDDRRPPAPLSPPPPDLRLPWLQTATVSLHVDELLWGADGHLQGVQADYRYHVEPALGPQHILRVFHARLLSQAPWGRWEAAVDGQLQWQATGAQTVRLQLAAQAQATRTSLPPQRLRIEAQAEGTLAGPEARLTLQAQAQQPDSRAGAVLRAELAPWAAQPLRRIEADLHALNLALLWPRAPRSALHGWLRGQPTDAKRWTLQAELRNLQPAPWDRGGLPLERLRVQAHRHGQDLELPELQLHVGSGFLHLRSRMRLTSVATPWGALPAHPLQLALRLHDLPLPALWSAAPPRRLQAEAQLEPASTPNGPQRWRVQGQDGWLSWLARGQWQPNERLQLDDAQLRVDGLQALWAGSLIWTRQTLPSQASGALSVEIEDLARLPATLQRGLAGLSPHAGGASLDRLQRQLTGWQGRLRLRMQGWRGWPLLQPEPGPWQLELAVAGLRPPARDAPAAWQVQRGQLLLQGAGAQAQLQGQTELQWGARSLELRLEPVQLRGLSPALPLVRLDSGTLRARARDVSAAQALLRWDAIERQNNGTWRGSGQVEVAALPAWLAWWGRPWPREAPLQPSADLALGARWQIQLQEQAALSSAQLQGVLERTAGDLKLQPDGPQGPQWQAGVRRARLQLDASPQRWRAALAWDSERAGQLELDLQAEPSTPNPEPAAAWWPLAPETRWQGRWNLKAPPLQLLTPWLPPGWRVGGQLQGQGTVGGAWARPALRGELLGHDLELAVRTEGIDWRGGVLQARLDEHRLQLVQLHWPNPAGEPDGGLQGRGQLSWTDGWSLAQADITLQARRWLALARADRRVRLSGDLQIRTRARLVDVQGQLQLDQARWLLPPADKPRLSDDVVVRGQPQPARRSPWPAGWDGRVELALDLGTDTELQGRGLQTGLTGNLRWRQRGEQPARLDGEVRTVRGRYQAWGQTLDIERGLLRFNGALDDPQLDVRAVRRFSEQTVGVHIEGRAQAPVVRLYADPSLPDTDILAWLALGRPLSGPGAQAALLQRAAQALWDRRGGSTMAGLPQALGLDELTLEPGSRDADGNVRAASVSLGKRLSEQLYLGYERSLLGLTGTVSVLYDLSRYLTLRGRAGDDNALELLYRRRFD
ncbi:Translocation and assembly module TamB [Tepidimonas alkaliphilus]|uniref:Translocation and assembly module TamB n=1 Tax=Tepidimonas alkaliphilus TaxID=2588942 RepID=A0A554WCU3_9BURK|nr:translocation/assembly module TamB domain-containing protein [Tepidimonas alkaliphilus]TSE21393.1 Translocation and assembly module TamB [Tepidimonas alkaliphilus]